MSEQPTKDQKVTLCANMVACERTESAWLPCKIYFPQLRHNPIVNVFMSGHLKWLSVNYAAGQ